MKQRLAIFALLLIVCAFLACQQTSDETGIINPHPKLSPEEQQVLIAQAKDFKNKGRLTEALRCLAPIKDKTAFPYEVGNLYREIDVEKFKKDIEIAQDQSHVDAVKEVQRELVLPENYGETMTITGEKITNKTPEGLMESLVNRKVSMDLRNAGVQEVVMALSDINGLNIIADQALSSPQRLTVKVAQVPLKELLSYIARNMGIAFHLGENVIWVTAAMTATGDNGPKLETRIYKLRAGIVPTIGDSDVSGGNSELDDALQTFLTAGPPDSAYRIYRNRNLLMVKNTPENLRQVETMLDELDKPIPQVLIEARFITISQQELFELGYNLANITPRDPDADSEIGRIDNNLLRNFPQDGNMTVAGVIGDYQYEVVIHALDEMTTSRTISAPRITVLNNHTGMIRRGDTLRYYEEYELETIPNEGGVAVTQPVPTGDVQEIELGINFEVHPTISHDRKRVMLDLSPNIVQFMGFDEFITARLPRTNESELQTVVVVDSGQTVVLGGMITETKENDAYNIPFLSTVPLVGHLFGHKNRRSNPIHLLIFVTAKILDGSGKYVQVQD